MAPAVLYACVLQSAALQAAAGAPARREPPLVIRGATLFDSVGGTMLPARTVVVRAGRIAAIGGPGNAVRTPRGARVLDARGKFLLPGLIDGHVHLVHQLRQSKVTGDRVLPLFLANGVTAVRGTGDEIVAQALVARFAQAHPEACPDVYLCSPLIDGEPPFHPGTGWALTDAAQVPAFVNDMAAWGVRTLKLYVRVGRDVFRAVIEEGHRRGLAVTAHLGSVSAQDAVVDGLDCIEHIWGVWYFAFPDAATAERMDLDNPRLRGLIASMAEKRVAICPTLVEFEAMYRFDTPEVVGAAGVAQMPRRVREQWALHRSAVAAVPRERREREFRAYQELTGMLYRAGVPILAGTDTCEPFVPPGFSLLRELELLVASGLPPAAALQAATLRNAQALRATADIGSLEVGRRADMVLLDADPTADIANVRRIHRVVHGGRVGEPDEILRSAPAD